MPPLTSSPIWQALKTHAGRLGKVHLRDLFAQNPRRFEQFSLSFNDCLLDFSKQRVDRRAMELLREFAEACRWSEWIDRMCSGERINHTEHRAVGHVRLRAGDGAPADVQQVLERMRIFCDRLHAGNWLGFSGKPISDVVNLGIGGSDLGPRMVVTALSSYRVSNIKVHFVANVDGSDLAEKLDQLDPATTLFIVASKTFTTQETLTNAQSAKRWLTEAAGNDVIVSPHFVAASTNLEATKAFGIPPDNVFPFADWVGGRFSLWSSIGLPIALAVGYENFSALLAGARAMDAHFLAAPAESNLPLTLALLSFWNNNFLHMGTQGVFPYSHALRLFPAYLQQLEMESNGKRIDREGKPVDYATSPIVWGEAGTNGQHSFFQLLHQGTHPVASDFIAYARPDHALQGHHEKLLANCLAQSSALAFGLTESEVRASGCSEELLPYRIFPGNQASTTLFLPQLSPETLGQLIALYEHKVFCQSILWHLNAYDQWGVELGKQLAHRLESSLGSGLPSSGLDQSSNGLLAYFHQQLQQIS